MYFISLLKLWAQFQYSLSKSSKLFMFLRGYSAVKFSSTRAISFSLDVFYQPQIAPCKIIMLQSKVGHHDQGWNARVSMHCYDTDYPANCFSDLKWHHYENHHTLIKRIPSKHTIDKAEFAVGHFLMWHKLCTATMASLHSLDASRYPFIVGRRGGGCDLDVRWIVLHCHGCSIFGYYLEEGGIWREDSSFGWVSGNDYKEIFISANSFQF